MHPDRPNPFWLWMLFVAVVTFFCVHESPPFVDVSTYSGCGVKPCPLEPPKPA